MPRTKRPHKHEVKLTDEENKEFIRLFKLSGAKTHAEFIRNKIFNSSDLAIIQPEFNFEQEKTEKSERQKEMTKALYTLRKDADEGETEKKLIALKEFAGKDD